ncbi:hypothetical protein [Pseudoalteromonas sp. OOF1S-7]|uniref:hypothetical protein n=1 Tax=Pseudoalteromonas sp. OOF1S-7 TaxID=2917757 RepID=UPI001EF57C34|nr:hypothetical protein [Pseudoalteromonas sp. OOF1S-7]MCG7535190.1 hypothetical protein [Pseudoalteromonas sp. OOF1S-7]
MNYLKRTLLMLAFLVPTLSHGKGYMTGLYDTTATVSGVFVHSNGGVTLFVKGLERKAGSCDNIGNVHIRADNPAKSHFLSVALTAFAAEQKIGLYMAGCEVIPFWAGTATYPIISELWIIK